MFLLCLISCSFSAPVNPAAFTCTKWSPISEPEWSTGTPSVALTHIFCGEIKKTGTLTSVDGFHARPGNKNPASARARDFAFDKNSLRCFRNEDVYDAKDSEWRSRIVPATGHFCFFPQTWSKSDIVTNIQRVYDHCQAYNKNKQICGRNYAGMGFDVILFMSDTNPQRVVTSFATLQTNQGQYEYPCNLNNNCPLQNLPPLNSEALNRELWLTLQTN